MSFYWSNLYEPMPLDEDLHIFMVEGGVLDGPSDVRRTVEEILVFESGEQERHTAGGVGRGHAEKKIIINK